MPTMEHVIARGMPESLRNFIRQACATPVESLQQVPAPELPEPAKQLLDHPRDMTSTLANFHGSQLRVEILQQRQIEELYLREVFLRTRS
ncbi:MAG TPA: hypothetical protein VM029_04420, partial [Opitutaceae bacterium]|nr:hypothetical protein [Opitutaceae bacterium]